MSKETRWDELCEQWVTFHKAHPEVWQMFCQFTLDRIRRGFKNYSADAIFHRIRWEMQKPDYEVGKEFKLNDHYTAFYARAFMKSFPEHYGFFRTRTQVSRYGAPCNLPDLGPEAYGAH